MPAKRIPNPTRRSLYERTQRRYPVAGVVCEGCGLAPAVDRHHIDRDIANEAPENILRLCEPCHHRQHLRTACRRGHPLEGHNLVIDKQGRRGCRTCQNLRHLRLYYRKRYGQVPEALAIALGP